MKKKKKPMTNQFLQSAFGFSLLCVGFCATAF